MPNQEELRSQLEALRPVYNRSKKREAGEDPEWEIERKLLFTKMLAMVKSFQSDDPPSKAAYILGNIRSIADHLDAARYNVMQFESLRKRVVGNDDPAS